MPLELIVQVYNINHGHNSEANASEVLNMLFGEWDKEEYLEVACEEDREAGMEQEKLIIAKNLLSEGSTPEFVQRITGLSLDEIEEIDF